MLFVTGYRERPHGCHEHEENRHLPGGRPDRPGSQRDPARRSLRIRCSRLGGINPSGIPAGRRPAVATGRRSVAGEPRSVSLVTDASLDEIIVEWALAAVGGDRLVSVTGLREGGPPRLMGCEASVRVGTAAWR